MDEAVGRARKVAEGLSADEKEALLIALRATYRPGIVAAQTRFHGKPNSKGREAADMLAGLARDGLLSWADSFDNTDVRTSGVEYRITKFGREVAAMLSASGQIE